MTTAPVAITGMGCICAAGNNLNDSLAAMFTGLRSPSPPTRFSSDHPLRYPVFAVQNFDEPDGMLRTSALGLHAAREALQDAGLEGEFLQTLRVGVCIGTTVGCAMSNEKFCREYRAGKTPGMEPLEVILHSNPATVIAREFGFNGPCQTIVNACSSGTDAIGLAASWIRSGICDVALAGGADELGRITYVGFISLMISDDTPCKPFDINRKGLNLGEAGAVMVLESERVRSMRKKKAKSFVLGYGSACDAYHLTAPKPDGAGLKKAITEALDCSGLDPSIIAFVNAHGTGTPENDRVETLVLAEILPGVPFHSTKGYTGHTLGTAGAIEAIFTAAFLERGEIPASAGYASPDPELSGTPVTENTRFNGVVALSESLAFGGNNSVIILGKGERA